MSVISIIAMDWQPSSVNGDFGSVHHGYNGYYGYMEGQADQFYPANNQCFYPQSNSGIETANKSEKQTIMQ